MLTGRSKLLLRQVTRLYLYNHAEDHLITEKAFKAFQIEVDSPEVSKTLQNIPTGEYSLVKSQN